MGGRGYPHLRGQRGWGVIPSLRHNWVGGTPPPPSPPLPHPAYRLRRGFHAKYRGKCWKRGGGYPLPSRTKGEGVIPTLRHNWVGGYPPHPLPPVCFFLEARDPARTRKLPENSQKRIRPRPLPEPSQSPYCCLPPMSPRMPELPP